jgi:purine-cytosine permease-like protein
LKKKIIEPGTIIIGLFIAIPIIIILLLLAYYRSSLLNINGVLDKDFFPAFGSFLGSTVGIIISLGTILLVYYTYQSQQEQLKITRDLVN